MTRKELRDETTPKWRKTVVNCESQAKLQPRNAEVIGLVVRQQRNIIEQGCRGNPSVGGFDPPAVSSSSDHRFRPLQNEVM